MYNRRSSGELHGTVSDALTDQRGLDASCNNTKLLQHVVCPYQEIIQDTRTLLYPSQTFHFKGKKCWKMLVLSSVFVASSLLLKEISNDHILHTLVKREQN